LKTEIKASCIQFCPEFGDTVGSINRIFELTTKAESDLVVFPELITSGYEFKDREECFSLSIDVSNSSEFANLIEIAVKTHTYLVLGFPERAGDQVFNSSALISPSGETNIYRKIQLFDREKEIFDPGDEAPKVIKTEIGNIGMMICFDWIFPEICRSLALDGAHIICHPSNLVLSYCQRAMFARSVENGVFTITCNRYGVERRTDRQLQFTGRSQILSPKGKLLAQASENEDSIIFANIRPADADDKKLTDLNQFFEDRRPEFYQRLQTK